MRPSLTLFAILAVSPAALAGGKSSTGSSSGGGRLGQVSSGIGQATGASGSSSHAAASSNGNAETTLYGECERYYLARERNHQYYNVFYDERCRDVIVLQPDGTLHRRVVAAPREPSAILTGYAGAQKVYESDGSLTLALSVVDHRFRLDGSLTHYYEDQMAGGRITMTMPELAGGVRLDPSAGPTHLWLEGGVAIAKTKGDPDGNSSITGPTVGARLEHALSPRTALTGTATGMFFPDQIRAFEGRVGVRFNHVEASFRVLDFNVGPALFGPELGVGF